MSASDTNLFAYGSLMIPDVLHRLLARQPVACPAVLSGYRRNKLLGRTYPGIVPASDHEVHGLLLQQLGETELDILDAFEDELYERISVTVDTGEQQLSAYAYCVLPKFRTQLSQAEWDLEHFREHHLPAFLGRV